MKKLKQQKAQQLRIKGFSVGEIAKKLSVAKSSVSLWVRGLELSEQAHSILKKKNPALPEYTGIKKASQIVSQRAMEKRLEYQVTGRKETVKNPSLHLMGCMLYWAEGDKSKNEVKLTNYDPKVLSIFVKFLRVCYGLKNDDIRIRVVCYSDETREVNEKYWLNLLKLPKSSLRYLKTVVSIPKKKSNKHIHGGCAVEVYNTEVIQRIYGSIKEYAHISDDNKWLF